MENWTKFLCRSDLKGRVKNQAKVRFDVKYFYQICNSVASNFFQHQEIVFCKCHQSWDAMK